MRLSWMVRNVSGNYLRNVVKCKGTSYWGLTDERLVTVGEFWKQEGLHKKKQRRFISCT